METVNILKIYLGNICGKGGAAFGFLTLFWKYRVNVNFFKIYLGNICGKGGAAYGFIHSLGMKIDGGPALHQ